MKFTICRYVNRYSPKIITGPNQQINRITKALDRKKGCQISSTIYSTNRITKANFNSTVENSYIKFFKIILSFFRYDISSIFFNPLKSTSIYIGHGLRNFEILSMYFHSKITKTPYIVIPHGELESYKLNTNSIKYWIYQIIDNIITKRIIHDAVFIVTNSNWERETVLKIGVPPEKVKCIFAPLRENFFEEVKSGILTSTENENQMKYLKILTVCRFQKDRGLKNIIRIAEILKLKGIKYEWNIVGGAYSEYENEFNQLKIYCASEKLNVKFIGIKYGRELTNFYSNSDIFIYNSKYENYGQAIAEAVASGLMVISSPVGFALEFPEAENMILCKTNTEFVNSIIQISNLLDHNMKLDIRLDRIQNWQDELGIETIINQYLNIFSMTKS